MKCKRSPWPSTAPLLSPFAVFCPRAQAAKGDVKVCKRPLSMTWFRLPFTEFFSDPHKGVTPIQRRTIDHLIRAGEQRRGQLEAEHFWRGEADD
jgi:hypothetical protein